MSESTELTLPQRAAVALKSSQHEAELLVLSKKYADLTEIKNPAGREQVHSAYMELKSTRVAIQKAAKDAREDANQFSKAVIAEAERLTTITTGEEVRLQALRDEWDAEREREKQVKAAAEKARVEGIRKRIADTQAVPAKLVGQPSKVIAEMLAQIEAAEITLEEFMELAGEAELAKVATVAKLREMLAAQQTHEAEQARLAEERAQLERERAEAAERERQAAAARAEQERKDREAREAEDALVDSIWKNARRIETNTPPYIRKAIGTFESMAKDWENDPRPRVSGAIASAREEMQMKLRQAEEVAEREAHEAELRRQREAEEARLAEARREIERQQAEIDAAKAEQERREREAREQAEAAERARKLEADHIEALAENERIDRERAEAKRLADEAYAAEQERVRRAMAEFEATGPEDWEIVQVIADHYDVTSEVARHWLARHVWMEKAA